MFELVKSVDGVHDYYGLGFCVEVWFGLSFGLLGRLDYWLFIEDF